MIKRKIYKKIQYKKIQEWKETTNGSRALLIEGAGRIGKSTVVTEIGKNEYKSFILVDFSNVRKKILDLFDNLNELDVLFQTLSLEYNTRLSFLKFAAFFIIYLVNRL